MANLQGQQVEALIAGVEWEELAAPVGFKEPNQNMPFATHHGVLELFGYRIRCYRLSNGQAVFHADDVIDFLVGGIEHAVGDQ